MTEEAAISWPGSSSVGELAEDELFGRPRAAPGAREILRVVHGDDVGRRVDVDFQSLEIGGVVGELARSHAAGPLGAARLGADGEVGRVQGEVEA